ncbi:MAG: lecithin retinol acyltransferase family protein [Candidatus Sedimenticola sp. (ex Thyasira tokunagai)]
MEELAVNPGDVVVTDFGVYQHWSLVTDRVCDQGKPMLISATKRNGTVREEPWDVVTQGKNTYVANVETSKPIHQLLADARSQIGTWAYSVTSKNCEHFINWTSGLKVTSKQVVAGVGGAAAGATLVGMLSENPKLLKFLGGALVVGGIAVVTTRAVEKRQRKNA